MGEIPILKDDPKSTDWYVAEVLRVLDDRMVVSYYTTKQAPLDDFSSASRSFRTSNLKEARFRKTWVLNFGKGVATQSPPKNTARIIKDLWTGKVSRLFWDEQLLVRNVHISSKGKLDDVTISILSKLRIPHHLGA